MEGGPAPNAYGLPAAIGFGGHTLTRRREPAVTIGLKLDTGTALIGHGLPHDLRDLTRFGRTHRPSYHFSYRKPTASEGVPAPNSYDPKMDSVRPKAPQASFQGRTKFGRVENCYPSPNTYTLKPVAIQRAKPTTEKTFAPRFPWTSENGPAPNSYTLPTPDAYKYKRMTNTLAIPRRNPEITNDITPPPNAYHMPKATGQAKTFGKKPTYKRTTYITYEDNAY